MGFYWLENWVIILFVHVWEPKMIQYWVNVRLLFGCIGLPCILSSGPQNEEIQQLTTKAGFPEAGVYYWTYDTYLFIILDVNLDAQRWVDVFDVFLEQTSVQTSPNKYRKGDASARSQVLNYLTLASRTQTSIGTELCI